MSINDYNPTPLASFPSLSPASSKSSEHDEKKWKKTKKKAKKEKEKRQEAEAKCEKLKYKRKAERALHAERERSYKLECELKYRRKLINFMYPDLDKKLGECFGGEDSDES